MYFDTSHLMFNQGKLASFNQSKQTSLSKLFLNKGLIVELLFLTFYFLLFILPNQPTHFHKRESHGAQKQLVVMA